MSRTSTKRETIDYLLADNNNLSKKLEAAQAVNALYQDCLLRAARLYARRADGLPADFPDGAEGLAKLAEERDRLQTALDISDGDRNAWISRCARLDAEVARLRAALAIYADPQNWRSDEGAWGESVDAFCPVTGFEKPYDFAEAALKGGE